MVILTFIDSTLPSWIYVEDISIQVRPYRHRPLQCFKCYRYGHSAKVCGKSEKLCEVCSQAEHGECSRQPNCVNCSNNHKSRNRDCDAYKKEEEALQKAQDEHISVGFAKKLLSKGKYSDIVKKGANPLVPSSPASPRPHRGTGVAGNPHAAPIIPPRDSGSLYPSEKLSSQNLQASQNNEALQLESLLNIEVVMHKSGAEYISASASLSPSPLIVAASVHQDNDGNNMEAEAIRQKRPRAQSSSPPRSRSPVLPTKNRFDMLERDNEIQSNKVKPKHTELSHRSMAKGSHGKPSLSRPSSSRHDNKSHGKPSKKQSNKK